MEDYTEMKLLISPETGPGLKPTKICQDRGKSMCFKVTKYEINELNLILDIQCIIFKMKLKNLKLNLKVILV